MSWRSCANRSRMVSQEYNFAGVRANETYTVSVASKRYSFPQPAQVVTPDEKTRRVGAVSAVALGTALSLYGLDLGPISISANSKLIPILIIAIIYVPYMARPIRGQVLTLREKEFVEAARAQGASPLRIMLSEILPNLSSIVIVFFPLMVANAILLEAALSFLGAGVQAPNSSWGTMIAEGVERIISAPHLAIAPGAMLVITVLALNVFGDGVRDAFDPRATVRLEH